MGSSYFLFLKMGSSKLMEPVDLANLPVIRRNPDRHAKRIGYQKTRKEITKPSAKKSKPKIETVKKPLLKRTLPNCEKTLSEAPEAPKMPYVEPWTKYMRMCRCGVKHIMHVRNDWIFPPGDHINYKAKPVYYNGRFIPHMECSEIQVTDKEEYEVSLRITSAYFSALEGYMNCYKEYLDEYEIYLAGFTTSFQKGSKPPTQIKIDNWGPLHDQSYSKADQAKIAEKHTWEFGDDAVYSFGPMPDLREFNKDPSDWYEQLEKFQVKFTPKTTLKKLYTNLQERYLHLYRKHYQTYSAKLTKT